VSLIRTKESKRAIKDRKIRQRKGNPYNFIEETGQRFGRLEVIACAGRWKNTNEATWLCRCDCGNKTIVRGISLRRGCTRSCGCLHKEQLSDRNRSIINPLKPKYVALIKDLHSQGFSMAAIARELEMRQLPTLTGKTRWYASTVKWLLQ
jgi:hypothetical protein